MALQHLAKQPSAAPTVLATVSDQCTHTHTHTHFYRQHVVTHFICPLPQLHKACQSLDAGDIYFSTHIDCTTWMVKGCQSFFTALHFKAKPDSAQVVSLSTPNPLHDHRHLLEMAMDSVIAVFGRSRGRRKGVVPV